jgi:hypothetical protein
MDDRIASMHHFWCSTHAQKVKRISFLMQLVPCLNSFEIIENHQNNVFTVATNIADVISARCYRGWLGRQCTCAGSGASACDDRSWWWGSLRWPKLMVEAACEMARPNGCGDVRACGWGSHPCRFQVHLIIAGVGRQVAIIFIYLFKKYFIAMGLLTTTDPLVLCYTRAMGPPRPSLLCDHCSDEIITMNCLPIAIVD